jgi:hypothetical protein
MTQLLAVAALPCDADTDDTPAVTAAVPPVEPAWSTYVASSVFVDGRDPVRATIRTSSNGAQYLDITIEPRDGGTLNLALSLAAQANLAEAISQAIAAASRTSA